MKALTSPYKQSPNPPPLRKVIADVSVADWERIYLPLPFRGQQDAIVATLLRRFALLVEQENLPTHYEPENARRIESLLRGAALPPID